MAGEVDVVMLRLIIMIIGVEIIVLNVIKGFYEKNRYIRNNSFNAFIMEIQIQIDPELIKKAQVERIWNEMVDDNAYGKITVEFKCGEVVKIKKEKDILF